MKVWAVAVVVFFGAAELYQWLQHLTLPLPVYGLAGLLLAVVSNAEHWPQAPAKSPLEPSKLDASLVSDSVLSPEAAPTHSLDISSPISPHISQTSPRSDAGPQLPKFPPAAASSISFTIRKK